MNTEKNITLIINELNKKYSGLKVIKAWGETSLFYNPNNILKHGIYFCTFKDKDSNNDKASNLTRTNFFRMNFSISKDTFMNIFNEIPKRAIKGGIIEGKYDFTKIDILTPHPIYG